MKTSSEILLTSSVSIPATILGLRNLHFSSVSAWTSCRIILKTQSRKKKDDVCYCVSLSLITLRSSIQLSEVVVQETNLPGGKVVQEILHYSFFKQRLNLEPLIPGNGDQVAACSSGVCW